MAGAYVWCFCGVTPVAPHLVLDASCVKDHGRGSIGEKLQYPFPKKPERKLVHFSIQNASSKWDHMG